MFFVRGVVETVKKLRWDPGFVHCIGWISSLSPMYLRRIFADDPTFAGSKIIYSLFSDKFEGTLDPRFAEKLLIEGFSQEDIASIADKPVDWIALNKLAIDYSDAVAQSSPDIDPELLDYIEKSGKPFLPFSETDTADRANRFAEFYRSLQ